MVHVVNVYLGVYFLAQNNCYTPTGWGQPLIPHPRYALGIAKKQVLTL